MVQRRDSIPRRRARREFNPGPWLMIIAVGAALRLLVAVTVGPPQALPADPRVVEAAAHLSSGEGLSLATGAVVSPTAAVPPLAPALLAATSSLFRSRPNADILLACMLGALVPLFLGQLAATLHGPTVGRVAGWIGAVDPLLVAGGGLLQEQVFAVCLTAALVLTANWLRTPRWGRGVGCGAAWGVCTLAWTPGLALALAAMAWAWGPLGLVAGMRERLRHLGAVALGACCVVIPWTARNAIVVRAAAPVTTSTGTAFLSGNNSHVWNTPRRRGGRIDVLSVEPYAARLRVDEPRRDAVAWRSALDFVRDRGVLEHLAVVRDRTARLWTPELLPDDPESAPASNRGGRVALAVMGWVIAALAAWGFVRALSGARRWFQSLPALVLLVVTAGSAAFYGSSRTRLGIEPLVALLAALGLQDARRRFHLQRTGLRLVTKTTGSRT